MKRLSDRSEEWSKEIQTTFYEEFPFFIQYPLQVNLVRKDVKKGFGIGNIVVTDAFAVPVIIDSFILKDFDVAMLNGKTIPLTPESITDIFSNPSAFQASGETMQDSKLTKLFSPDLSLPSDYGNTAASSGYRYTKTAMLHKVLPFASKENIEKVASFYSPQDLASFKKNKTESVLSEFLSATPMEDDDFNKIATENLDLDYTFMYKVARDHYRAYFMNPLVDHMQVMDLNEEEYQTQNIKLANAREAVENTELKLKLKPSQPAPGVDGLITDGKNHVKLAITNVLTTNGNTSIEGLGTHLKHLTLDVAHVNSIEKVAEGKYLIPTDYKFFELGLEGGDKVAVDTSNRVIKDGVTGHFTFQGPVFDKYASNNHDTHNVPAEQAFVTAAHCGVCAEDIVKMANLKRDTPFYFDSSELNCPMPLDEFVEKLAELSEQDKIDVSIIKDNIDPLLKLAARVEEDFIVDKVLSIGAINEKSIKEFINYIPVLEETASYLARLLVMVRLGQRGLSEQDIEQAMEALSRIILHLKNVANTNKNAKELVQ